MPSPFRPATELLVQYARLHRDRRNILTHAVGIPMVVFALGVLLGRPRWDSGWTPAWALWCLTAPWYLSRGQVGLGLAATVLNAALLALATPLAATEAWLVVGLGALMLGWTAQWAGHYYEGRRAEAVDDLTRLLVGPLFVAAEALFALGRCRPLREQIERAVGPSRLRDLTVPA